MSRRPSDRKLRAIWPEFWNMYDEVRVTYADKPVICVLQLGLVRLFSEYGQELSRYMLPPSNVRPNDPDYARAFADIQGWLWPSEETFAIEAEKALRAKFEPEDATRMFNLFMTRNQKGRTASQRQWWIEAYEKQLVYGAGPQDVIQLCQCGKQSHLSREPHTADCKKRLRLGITQLKKLLTRHHLDRDLVKLVEAAKRRVKSR